MTLRRSIYELSLLLFLFTGLAGPAQAQQPYGAPDDAWINVPGTVAMVHDDVIVVDYGENVLKVEMADEDRMASDYELRSGDSVVVAGRIDDRTFEARTLEAQSVYVDKHDTYYYDGPRDERRPVAITISDMRVAPVLSLTGVVIDRAGALLEVRVGDQNLIVDTSTLEADASDDYRYPEIDVGDRVEVTGRAGPDFLDGGPIEAEAVREVPH